MELVLGRNNRAARWLTIAVAIGCGVTLTAGCGSSGSSQSSSSGGVALNPASGPVASTPKWSTSEACPAGYQGSGLFSAVQSDGSYLSIAQVVDDTNVPFNGTLEGSLTQIKSLSNIPNGGTQELFVICSSQQGGTGKTLNVMKEYITYSADGKTYTTSATR